MITSSSSHSTASASRASIFGTPTTTVGPSLTTTLFDDVYENVRLHLVIKQQPVRARKSGFSNCKDRRLVDPPPILQLFASTKDGRPALVPPDLYPFLVCHASLWSPNGREDRSVVIKETGVVVSLAGKYTVDVLGDDSPPPVPTSFQENDGEQRARQPVGAADAKGRAAALLTPQSMETGSPASAIDVPPARRHLPPPLRLPSMKDLEQTLAAARAISSTGTTPRPLMPSQPLPQQTQTGRPSTSSFQALPSSHITPSSLHLQQPHSHLDHSAPCILANNPDPPPLAPVRPSWQLPLPPPFAPSRKSSLSSASSSSPSPFAADFRLPPGTANHKRQRPADDDADPRNPSSSPSDTDSAQRNPRQRRRPLLPAIPTTTGAQEPPQAHNYHHHHHSHHGPPQNTAPHPAAPHAAPVPAATAAPAADRHPSPRQSASPGAAGSPPPQQQQPRHTVLRCLLGSLSSMCQILHDTDDRDGYFFTFPDLSVRLQGLYRLRFVVVDVRHCKSVALAWSDVFEVFSAKMFPGMTQSTPLSRRFARQGVGIHIRFDPKADAFRPVSAAAAPAAPATGGTQWGPIGVGGGVSTDEEGDGDE
ncbi:velvet factor-domain-containing protein [Zopfochytrium polystomum]|nr:velvet factor-domain-containing protein [Zopfochytrium polystomum]